jgi:hypothetical protein
MMRKLKIYTNYVCVSVLQETEYGHFKDVLDQFFTHRIPHYTFKAYSSIL